MSHPWFTHSPKCSCIDCTAYRDWRGPASIKPPSIIDVGEHKLEVWKMRAPREGDGDATPRRKAAPRVTTTTAKDAHPFGYKRRRKAVPMTGNYGNMALVTVTRRQPKATAPQRAVTGDATVDYVNSVFDAATDRRFAGWAS